MLALANLLKIFEEIKSTGSENGEAKGYLVGAFVSVFIHPFQEKKFDLENIRRHAKAQYQSVKGKARLKGHIFHKFVQLCIFCLFVYIELNHLITIAAQLPQTRLGITMFGISYEL